MSDDTPNSHYRPTERDDIARLPEIDRSEVAQQHHLVRDGQLALLEYGFTHQGAGRTRGPWLQPQLSPRVRADTPCDLILCGTCRYS